MGKILTFFFSFFALSLTGQTATWQQFYGNSTINGLAARENTILVATNFGLAQLDTLGNKTFYDAVNSGTPFTKAVQVAIDHSGQWWVAHLGGISKYNGSSWTDWDSTQVGLSFYTSNATALNALPDGRIVVGTSSRGCAIFENAGWNVFNQANSGLPSNYIRDIALGNDGKIYFATSAGLAILDGSNWTVFNSANTGITGFNDVKSVAVTSTGVIWVTSTLRFAKQEAGVWTEYTAASIGLTGVGFPGDVLVDGQDRLWLSFSKSISVLDGAVWTHYPEGNIGCTLPLSIGLKIKLAMDGAGQLWTSACGLTRFNGQNWDKFDFGNATLPAGQLFAITQDTTGNMWFAGSVGIAKKEGDTWQSFGPAELGLSEPSVMYTGHADAHGNVWFGVGTGEILRFDGTDWTLFDTTFVTFPDFYSYWSIASAPDGSVWFSLVPPNFFASRLARYKNGEWTFFTPDNAPLAPNYDIVGIAVESDNTAWFVANDRLLKYDGANWESFNPANSGLPFTVIRYMDLAPDGAVWLATNAGLARFDGTDWTTLTTGNSGIPSDNVYRVTFDRAGGMYVGYDPDVKAANCAVFRGGEWAELLPTGYEAGFLSRPWPFFTDRDNRFWFSNWNDAGVFLYDPVLVKTNDPARPDQQLTLFPNPASNVLYIQMPGLENQRVQIRVTDPSGRLAYQQTAAVHANLLTLDLPAEWPAGLYYVETFGEQGERQSGRFVRAMQR
ncbi:MAG: T9SS type A sorting domain-containing protein [Saprospiraceae bacterium]|nr:T9SS type A sorting domain-containing protein [Saprospiraceae bacterium]